jgi:hypothetical protein
MASFCANCGSSLSGQGAFCLQCGAPVGKQANPVAAPPRQPAPAAVAPATKSGSALKIVIVLLCCLAVGGAAVVGGLIYVAHRVKKALVEEAAAKGVDLTSITSSSGRVSGSNRPLPKPCELLKKEEVSRLIGEPIERAEVRDAMCMYYGPPGLAVKLAQEQASGTFTRAQTPGAHVNGTEVANSVDQMVNSLAAQAGQTGSGGEMPLLMLAIDADGRAQMMAVSAGRAIFSGIGKSADSKGISFGSDIPGLGDKAIRVPKLGLNVLQGEILIRVIPGPFPDADAKTISVARAVLPKI